MERNGHKVIPAESVALSRRSCPMLIPVSVHFTVIMLSAAKAPETMNLRGQNTETVREKFREVFGCECTIRDEVLLRRYSLSDEGDLILFLR
jgi:hypothetical protein